MKVLITLILTVLIGGSAYAYVNNYQQIQQQNPCAQMTCTGVNDCSLLNQCITDNQTLITAQNAVATDFYNWNQYVFSNQLTANQANLMNYKSQVQAISGAQTVTTPTATPTATPSPTGS